MMMVERRWAGPAAAVLAFCLTLLFVAPPTTPAVLTTAPASLLADAAAVSAAHALLGLVAAAGLVLAVKMMLHRQPLKAQRVASRSTHIHAA